MLTGKQWENELCPSPEEATVIFSHADFRIHFSSSMHLHQANLVTLLCFFFLIYEASNGFMEFIVIPHFLELFNLLGISQHFLCYEEM